MNLRLELQLVATMTVTMTMALTFLHIHLLLLKLLLLLVMLLLGGGWLLELLLSGRYTRRTLSMDGSNCQQHQRQTGQQHSSSSSGLWRCWWGVWRDGKVPAVQSKQIKINFFLYILFTVYTWSIQGNKAFHLLPSLQITVYCTHKKGYFCDRKFGSLSETSERKASSVAKVF